REAAGEGRRAPRRGRSRPLAGRETAVARRQPVLTHWADATGAPISSDRRGRATLTTVVSRRAATAPTSRTAARVTSSRSSRSSAVVFVGMPTSLAERCWHANISSATVPGVASERPGRRRRFRHLATHIEAAPVGSLLLQVVRAHAQLGTRLLRREGVVPPQEIVLLHPDDQGPVSQADLFRCLGRARSTATSTLQAMERAGLTERTPSPTDRRAMVVGLTEEGRRRIPGARAAWHRLEEV